MNVAPTCGPWASVDLYPGGVYITVGTDDQPAAGGDLSPVRPARPTSRPEPRV